ncbi:MAG: hypothetical protein PHF00_07795, partial [Elusimicrobia bacterium]|nr:hypothetical protein [Elusimicrobiota bacterium]
MTALLLAAACALAAHTAEPAEVELVAPATAQLGVPLSVRAAAAVAPGETLELDLQRSTTDSFAVTRAEAVPAVGGRAQFELTIVPLDLGRQAFPLYWTLSAGGAKRSLAGALQLQVEPPAAAAQAQDVKDIKPPRRARPALWPWALLLAAAGALYFWLRGRRRRPKAHAPAREPEDDRPAGAVAEAELDRLARSGLWAEDRRKEVYARLTEI